MITFKNLKNKIVSTRKEPQIVVRLHVFRLLFVVKYTFLVGLSREYLGWYFASASPRVVRPGNPGLLIGNLGLLCIVLPLVFSQVKVEQQLWGRKDVKAW